MVLFHMKTNDERTLTKIIVFQVLILTLHD